MGTNKTKKINKNSIPEQEDPLASGVDGMETDNFDSGLMDNSIEEVPIDQLLQDPNGILQIDDVDSGTETEEEYAAWCPVCNDYTIFVDGTCTACGFTKNTRKSKRTDDSTTEEEEQNLLEVLDTYREEDLAGLDSYNDYVDNDDDT